MSAAQSIEAAGRIGRLSRFQSPTRFFTAFAVSSVGNWLTLVAAGVVVYRLTGSAAAPAALTLVRAVPRLAGPAIGAAIGDLLPLRRSIGVLLLGQALATALVIQAVHAQAVWAIFLFLALSQVLGAAIQPMLPAALARIVPRRQLGRASSLFSLTRSTTMLVGPAIGVVLLDRYGADWLFMADVLSFVLAMVLISDLRLRTVHGGGADRQRSVVHAALGGLRPVLGDPLLRLLSAAYLANTTLVWAVMSSLVVIAADRFGADANSGYLYAAVGTGGVLGAVFTLAIRPQRLSRSMITASMLAEVAPLALLPATHHLTLALLLLALSSAAGIPYQAWGGAELNRRLPAHLLTRGNAVPVFALFLGSVIGSLGATVIIPLVGWQADLLASAAAAVLIVGAALMIPVGTGRARGASTAA